MLLFTNNRWEILGAPLQTAILFICPAASSFFNMAVKPSAQSRKRHREIGLPYWIPLDGVILPLGSPLIRTEYDTVVTHIIMREIHLSWKPIFFIIASR